MTRFIVANPNACVFVVGLLAVCASVAQWSGPLAGVVGGVALMAVSVWPYLTARKG